MMIEQTVELPQRDDYRSLFLSNTPLLDVRAPVEFTQGAFPFTENLPLMNDHERTEIGIRYKHLGQDEAIKLGHKLIQGDIKSERIDHWENFIKQHPQGALYCFRGGMRSKISQQWIFERTGITYPRIKGGYKAMRRFLIDELEVSSQLIKPIILGGRTGAGKTLFLKNIKQQIDLEGIFHHRGSVFGRHATAQPSQIDIENTLSIKLLKFLNQGGKQIILEDEGNNIGSRSLPQNFYKKMQLSPIVLLEVSTEERINNTFQEYIIQSLEEYQLYNGIEQGYQLWTEKLQDSINKLQRRLGGVRHKEITALFKHAILQQNSGTIDSHKEWIKLLLVDYYDPMYDFQINKKQQRVIFKGNQNEVLDYLANQHQII